jgi:hypothetical protein
MKPVCSFQRPLYTSVIYGRTIAQHTRDAYCDFGSDIPVICVIWIDRCCVGVCCERSHSSDQRPGSIRCRKTGRRDKTASFRRGTFRRQRNVRDRARANSAFAHPVGSATRRSRWHRDGAALEAVAPRAQGPTGGLPNKISIGRI